MEGETNPVCSATGTPQGQNTPEGQGGTALCSKRSRSLSCTPKRAQRSHFTEVPRTHVPVSRPLRTGGALQSASSLDPVLLTPPLAFTALPWLCIRPEHGCVC